MQIKHRLYGTSLLCLKVTIENKLYAWVFDKQNLLGGEVSKESSGVTTTMSNDYRNVKGVWIPFKSVTNSKGQTTQLVLINAEVNVTLPDNVWEKP